MLPVTPTFIALALRPIRLTLALALRLLAAIAIALSTFILALATLALTLTLLATLALALLAALAWTLTLLATLALALLALTLARGAFRTLALPTLPVLALRLPAWSLARLSLVFALRGLSLGLVAFALTLRLRSAAFLRGTRLLTGHALAGCQHSSGHQCGCRCCDEEFVSHA